MEIREIRPVNVNISELDIPSINVFSDPQVNIPVAPPVTVDIGIPIVNIPGCVEAHEVDENDKLESEDPKGTVTYCDAGVPSFSPIDYNKSKLKMSGEKQIPQYAGEQPNNNIKETAPPPTTTPPVEPEKVTIECPTQKQLSEEPVGFIFDSGRKEVTGYKLVGNQCIREVRDVPIIEQAINGLPPTGVVITTGGIAVVATTSALLAKPFADILLKVIKPTVKKVLKKIATIRGKKPKVESVTERRAEQRLRNQAIAKLRSVAAKSQKKKG